MIDFKNGTFIGIVVDNKDPKKLGRCKVRVINVFDTIEVKDLPWASPWKDLSGNAFSVPDLGKMVTVVFEQGNIYKPEFIYAEHYNACLEDKLMSLEQKVDSDGRSDYNTMKVLLFDHDTQIYVNKKEGLKIDYQYNNINIKEKSITLNLKDTKSNLFLGDAKADQQAVLGNHWFEWFDKFMEDIHDYGWWSEQGNKIIPHIILKDTIDDYFVLREKERFLSRHVKIIDNEQVDTVINTDGSFPVKRFNLGIIGDFWKAFHLINNLAKKIKDAPRPWRKGKKKIEARYRPPQQTKPYQGFNNSQSQTSTPNTTSAQSQSEAQSNPPVQNPSNPQNSAPANGIINSSNSPATSIDYNTINPENQFVLYEEEDEIPKLLAYLESKSGSSPITGKTSDYEVYDDPYILNIIAFRNRKHEYGKITNKFDDQLWVFFNDEKNQWSKIRKYSVTTVPGYEVIDGNKIEPNRLPTNVGFINYGQYVNSYKLGYHNTDDYGKRHPALICDRVGIRINKRKGKFVTDKYVNTVVNTQFGVDVDGWLYDTGMNIHCTVPIDESVFGEPDFPEAGMVFDEVNNWSMGCIVFNNPEQYREFLGLCEEQKIKGKKSQYTLTVASYREFELFESGIFEEDLDQSDIDLEDRFPDYEEDDDLDNILY